MGGQHRSHPRRAEDGLPAPPEPWTRAGRCGQQACPLLRRPYFALEHWTLTETHTEPSHLRRFLTLSNVGGGPVELAYEGGSVTLGLAESCILPAAIGEVRVGTGEASLVACYVPDLERDVISPLRETGY